MMGSVTGLVNLTILCITQLMYYCLFCDMSLQANSTVAKSLATLLPSPRQLGAKIYNVPFQALLRALRKDTQKSILNYFTLFSKVEFLHFGTF